MRIGSRLAIEQLIKRVGAGVKVASKGRQEPWTEGFIEGDCVECIFHQGVFNIRTGAVVQPPCIVPVRTYPALVENGDVFIELRHAVTGAGPS